MAKYLRYWGEFVSREKHYIRVEIHQESDSAFAPVELGFPYDQPLMIEWDETDKIEPVQASSATLKVISETDREFIQLYTIKAGTIRMDVLRDGVLYWSGTLDSEIYEEPYSYKDRYIVEFTFSDFGVLDRMKWNQHGRSSWNAILQQCLDKASFSYTEIVRYISTKLEEYHDVNWDELLLANENFYDEDDEPSKVLEVLKAIMQPFALRIIQRSGKLYIYDLNSISTLLKQQVKWNETDASMNVDKVYNDAKISFSPYATDSIIDAAVEVDKRDAGGELIKTSYKTVATYGEPVPDGFRIQSGTGVTAHGLTLENGAIYFDIEAAFSGSDCSGVLWSYKSGDYGSHDAKLVQHYNYMRLCFDINDKFTGQKIITCPLGVFNYAGVNSYKYKLKINMDLLLDPRYNPFESDSVDNEEGNWGRWQSYNFVYVPIMLTLRDSNGVALYHFDNLDLVNSDNSGNPLDGKAPRWISGEGTPGCCYLAYYNKSDRGKSATNGWTSNQQCMGRYKGKLPDIYQKRQDGDYIDLPPKGGYLELVIYSGIKTGGKFGAVNQLFNDSNKYNSVTSFIRDQMRWFAYKDPKIELVNRNYTSVDIKDQEDTAYINAEAKEKLSVDTIVGTLDTRIPAITGKGIMYNELGTINKFYRAGVQDRLERLLLGTIYSQYATRRVVLSGTVKILCGFEIYEDASMQDSRFLLVADSQDIAADESEIEMIEFSEDNFEGIEYE